MLKNTKQLLKLGKMEKLPLLTDERRKEGKLDGRIRPLTLSRRGPYFVFKWSILNFGAALTKVFTSDLLQICKIQAPDFLHISHNFSTFSRLRGDSCNILTSVI